MSYSFTVTAATKDEAKAKAAVELDSIVAQQPNHAKDRVYVLANILSALDLLHMQENDPRHIRVVCYGSLMWADDPEQISGVTLHADAYCIPAGDE